MVVQGIGAHVETASGPRIRKSEPLKIEVVAERVGIACSEAFPKGRDLDLLACRCPHPDADQHGLRVESPNNSVGPDFADT